MNAGVVQEVVGVFAGAELGRIKQPLAVARVDVAHHIHAPRHPLGNLIADGDNFTLKARIVGRLVRAVMRRAHKAQTDDADADLRNLTHATAPHSSLPVQTRACPRVQSRR